MKESALAFYIDLNNGRMLERILHSLGNMYFDVGKWSYLQFGVMVPYIALGPSIVAGAFTLGVMQQIIRAFGKVESSFQFLVNSWTIIVELISVWKRLSEFEAKLNQEDLINEKA